MVVFDIGVFCLKGVELGCDGMDVGGRLLVLN